MAYADKNGEALFDKFAELKIVTGNYSANEFAAWFDTGEEDNSNFLKWFQENITYTNVLSADETKSYDAIESEYTCDDHYEQEFESLIAQYPDILNIDDNKLDIKLLEDELAMYEADFKHLDKIIEMQNEHKIKNNQQLSLNVKREYLAQSEEQKAFNECLEEAKNLDNVNREIENEIRNIANIFQSSNYESNFMYKMNLIDNTNYCFNVKSTVDEIIDRQLKDSNVGRILSGDLENYNLDNFIDPMKKSELNKLQTQLNKSLSKWIHAKVALDAHQSVLKRFDGMDDNDIRRIMSKTRTGDHNDSLMTVQFRLEEFAAKYSKAQVDLIKNEIIENDIKHIKGILEDFKSTEQMVMDIVALQKLLKELFNLEFVNIQELQTHCKELYTYIRKDLGACIMRTKSLAKISQNHKNNKNTSDDEKVMPKFMDSFESVSCDSHSTVISVQDVLMKVQNLESNCKSMEEKLFIEDIDHFGYQSRNLKTDITVLRNFLKSDCTKELVVVPIEIFHLFQTLDNDFEMQENTLKSLLKSSHGIKSKIETDKWYRYKRQLWMYFLVAPKKMLAMIEEIRVEVNNKFAQYFTNTKTLQF